MMSAAPRCALCDQIVSADDMVLRCPRAMGRRRTHEVLNAPPWSPGDPVRPGHSIHVRGCERAEDPSVYRDPPCTCHCVGVAATTTQAAKQAAAIAGFARSARATSGSVAEVK